MATPRRFNSVPDVKTFKDLGFMMGREIPMMGREIPKRGKTIPCAIQNRKWNQWRRSKLSFASKVLFVNEVMFATR